MGDVDVAIILLHKDILSDLISNHTLHQRLVCALGFDRKYL